MPSVTMSFSDAGIEIDFDEPEKINGAQLQRATKLLFRRIKSARLQKVTQMRRDEAEKAKQVDVPEDFDDDEDSDEALDALLKSI